MPALRVSRSSHPQAVAGAVAAILRNGGIVELEAVGAAAVNQTVKAVAIARKLLASAAIDLVLQPSFFDADMQGLNRTGIRFSVITIVRERTN